MMDEEKGHAAAALLLAGLVGFLAWMFTAASHDGYWRNALRDRGLAHWQMTDSEHGHTELVWTKDGEPVGYP